MILFKNVTMQYDNGTRALHNTDFIIEKGEFVFLIGSSGAGKSTIIKLLLREEVATSGDVYVGNINVGQLKRKKVPYYRRKIGVVFQDFRLLPNKTVYENVEFAMQVIGASQKNIRKRVPEVLSMVGLAHKAKVFPRELSGGEQQRVALARAIVNSPEVLIADEPTGNLDAATADEIMKILDTINKHGTTIIMVTHSEKIVESMNKRVITIDKGEVMSDEMNRRGAI